MGHSRREQQQQSCYSPSCGAAARQCIHQMDPGHQWAFHCHQSGFSVSSWGTHGCGKERLQWLGISTSLLQHTCMYSLAVTTLPALTPVTLSLLPPAALPCPQLFYSCLLPSPAIAFHLSTTHTSPVLHSPQLFHSLFQAPGFPRSCLDVSLFPTLNIPILPNRPTSFLT